MAIGIEDKERVVAVDDLLECPFPLCVGRVEDGREGVWTDEVTECNEVTLDEAGLGLRLDPVGVLGSSLLCSPFGVPSLLSSTSCILASVSARINVGREDKGGERRFDGDWGLGGGGGGEIGMSAGLRTIEGVMVGISDSRGLDGRSLGGTSGLFRLSTCWVDDPDGRGDCADVSSGIDISVTVGSTGEVSTGMTSLSATLGWASAPVDSSSAMTRYV